MGEPTEARLEHLVNFRTGKLNSNAAVDNGKYPFFTCSPETLRINDYAFDCEALLLAGNNAEGVFPLKYYKGKFNAYQRTYVITVRDPEMLSYGYLFYNLRTQLKELQNISHGSATKFLTLTLLNDIEIPLSPISEQKAIAEVLSSLDDKIDLLHRQNKTLESLAETLFRQWFNEEAEDSWETKTVSDVALINQASIDKDYEFEDIEYLDTGSITENIIEGFQFLRLADAPSRARRIVRNNDIVISQVRPIQRHYGLLKSTKPNTVVSTGFCVVSCKKIDPHFMYVFLTQKDMTEYLDIIADASTSAYPSLKPSDIANLEFKMPPKGLLDSFSAYASAAWQKLETNRAQIHSLTKTRDSLLPKLMNGEVTAV